MADKKPVYLLMITANNNNKYYKMIPQGATFKVEFGRVGATPQTSSYPMAQWDKKYNEKVKKGYVDKTDLIDDLIHKEKAKDKSEYKEIESKVIAEIVERLQAMAKSAIQSNYRVDSLAVTQAMVDEAQKHIDKLADSYSKMTLKNFNDSLIQLFAIIPRKMKQVNDWLAEKPEQFADIVAREQDLLDVMKGQVVQRVVEEDNKDDNAEAPQKTILDTLGLVFEECTDDDVKHIKELLGPNAKRFKNAWRVTNIKTQERFDKWVAENNITEIKELFHGSKNENWWSIIGGGLQIRPASAAANGSMLGRAIYTSPDSEKSVSYSSLSPYYWGSKPSSAFMGIMQIAYGKPYDIYAFDSKYYTYDYKRLLADCPGASCLHAHAGMNTGWGALRRDEVTVYNEDQCTIKYLVEFA